MIIVPFCVKNVVSTLNKNQIFIYNNVILLGVVVSVEIDGPIVVSVVVSVPTVVEIPPAVVVPTNNN
jgi:hypothetical protein